MKTIITLAGALCLGGNAGEFKHQTIDDKIQIGYGLAISDVQGDGKPDVLLVDKNHIVWYQNPTWQKHIIADNLTKADHVCIAAEDIDGDRKAEIAVGAEWNPGDTVNSGAVILLQAPEHRTQRWNPMPLYHDPTTHRMWWVRASGGGQASLVVAPLHGRGNKAGQGDPVHILEYLPGADGKSWRTNLVDASMHMTHNLDPVQWDTDGAQEILLAGREGVRLLDKLGDKWSSSVVIDATKNPGFGGAGEVRLGGGPEGAYIATIEPMHGTNLVVYSGRKGGDQWQRTLVDASLNDGHAIAFGKFEKNAAADALVAGWRGKNAEGKVGIKIYRQQGGKWQGETLDDNQMACEDLKVADLNGDGLPEVIAAGRATKNVKIYWNESK